MDFFVETASQLQASGLALAFMTPSQMHLYVRTLKNLVSVLRNYQIMLTSHAGFYSTC